MKKVINNSLVIALALLWASHAVYASGTSIAKGKNYATSTVAAGGYDVVAYRTLGKAPRGTGDHVATFAGETYLFANASNKAQFEKTPSKYAPAYGGYCAYGVAVGKKFVGDPEVWKIVDGTLYLNLNPKIQATWNKDIPGYITKADKHWRSIRAKSPAEL